MYNPRYSFANHNSEYDRATRSSGIFLRDVTLQEANDFILYLRRRNDSSVNNIYKEDIINLYKSLKPEKRDEFLLKDQALELIRLYEPDSDLLPPQVTP